MTQTSLSERLRIDHPRLRTLYITGYAASVAADRAGFFESEAVLLKPFTSAELLGKVREVLEST